MYDRLLPTNTKSHLWCLTDESGFEIFCQTPKKKKVQVLIIFFVRVIQSTIQEAIIAVVEPQT